MKFDIKTVVQLALFAIVTLGVYFIAEMRAIATSNYNVNKDVREEIKGLRVEFAEQNKALDSRLDTISIRLQKDEFIIEWHDKQIQELKNRK